MWYSVLWQAVVKFLITVRCEILTALLLKIKVFWDIVPCKYISMYQLTWYHVLEEFCLHSSQLLYSVRGGKFIFSLSDSSFKMTGLHRIICFVAAELIFGEIASFAED